MELRPSPDAGDREGVLQFAKETAEDRPSLMMKAQETTSVRKPKRTTEQLTTLIKERAKAFGPWPAKMTILLYPMDDTWEVMVSPGATAQEEEFRITVLWIATQMQVEFDLRLQ
jgi:hypothetical protein